MRVDEKDLVRRLWEAAYGGDLDSVDGLLAPDYRLHDLTNKRDYGPEEFKGFLAALRATVPGVSIFMEEQMSAESGRVVTRFTVRAPLRDASGQSAEPGGISINRVADGRVSESWVSWDTGRIERELGPPPEEDPDSRVRWWRWPPWR